MKTLKVIFKMVYFENKFIKKNVFNQNFANMFMELENYFYSKKWKTVFKNNFLNIGNMITT